VGLRTPPERLVEAPERVVEIRPRHKPRQPHQRVLQVDDRVQPLAEQILAAAGLLRRFHRKTPEIIVSDTAFRHFPTSRFPRESFKFSAFQLFQGRLGVEEPVLGAFEDEAG
jgi:hypothetical protein